MTNTQTSHEFLARAPSRLEESPVIWMTTVSPAGQPQTSVVWFIVDAGEILMFSKPSVRVRNVRAHPQVALNLDGNGQGGDIVTLEGTARVVDDHAPCSDNPAYVAKYIDRIERMGHTVESFAAAYPHAIRITLTRARW